MSKSRAVCDRVYVVGGPNLSHPYDCCVYLVDTGEVAVLIDAGAGLGTQKIEDNVRNLGFNPFRLSHIVATHCHIDHIGGLSALKHLYGSEIIAHQDDRAGIEGEDPGLTAASMYGLEYTPVMVDDLLMEKEEVHRIGNLDLYFLHTPGHTPGSISVYLDTKDGRVLFGQDIHGPFSPRWGSDLSQWRRSMELLLALDADILCEGHAGVYKGKKVRGYIESYLKRYSEV